MDKAFSLMKIFQKILSSPSDIVNLDILAIFRFAREGSWKVEYVCFWQVGRSQQAKFIWIGKSCLLTEYWIFLTITQSINA